SVAPIASAMLRIASQRFFRARTTSSGAQVKITIQGEERKTAAAASAGERVQPFSACKSARSIASPVARRLEHAGETLLIGAWLRLFGVAPAHQARERH